MTGPPGRRLGGAALSVALAQWGPALTSVPHLRRVLVPRLSGIVAAPHVALTYDDGPDPASTPHFLALLQRHDAQATFFLLGAHVQENAALVREMAAAGHELAVHGWDHRCLAWKRPGTLAGELRSTRGLIEDVAQVAVTRYRPPYGVITGEGLLASRGAGLETVLWSAWGRDWSARATPAGIARKVSQALRPGGTVLLHDSDRTSSPGSWRHTLTASELLLGRWSDAGLAVGPLAGHADGHRIVEPMLAP